ncbi:MAG TPA: DUF6194 family protein [Candidatus Limnocylindrales bacterium]|jgi:hypothetical protein
MTDEEMPRDEVVDYITTHFESVDTATYPPDEAPTAWFFSRDAAKHWPNFATLVTTDEHDVEQNSNLEARAAYRLNIGLGRRSFERLIDPATAYDYTATNVVIPHPTYAKQRWIAIVNPTRRTFENDIRPLLDEAFERLSK